LLLLKRMVTLLTLPRNIFQRDRRNALPSNIYNEFLFNDLLHGIFIGPFVFSFRRPMRGTGVLIGKFV
jgi:hypothetical protein